MSFEDSFHLFIRIEKFDDFSLPSAGSGKIQKKKDQDLEGKGDCKQGVSDFKHKLIGYYNNLNILYLTCRVFPIYIYSNLLLKLSHILSLQYQLSYTYIIKYTYVMQELTPQQYEITLKYMETTNEQNFDLAVSALKQHDFNLEHAVNSKFNPPNSRGSNQRNQRPQQSDEEIIRKYIEFVQRKNAEWSPLQALFGLVKGLVFASLGLLSALVPSIIRVKLAGTDFEKLYWNSLPNLFTTRSVPSLLKLTGNLSSKSVLVLISPPKVDKDILNFMNNPQLHKNISRNFYLTGHVVGHAELAGITQIQVPMLVVLRQNIFQEIKQVGRTRQLSKIDNNLLNVWSHQSRNLFKRDGNVLIKYRNFVNRMVGHYYEEEEEQEINLNQREMERQEIHQQNKAYQEMLEQTKKNKELEAQRKAKQEEERRIKQQVQHERQVRKLSIPDEPSQGEIVRLSFRCPDGSTIIRNFSSDEKLDVVYHWVELNENIVFEDQQNRKFQIMHSYPPAPLSGRREDTLREIFDSSQQKVVIKEL